MRMAIISLAVVLHLLPPVFGQQAQTVAPVLDKETFDFSWGGGEGLNPYQEYRRPNVSIRYVWQPTEEGQATYNHHCIIRNIDGVVYGLFSTGDFGEGNIGQYVRYVYSTDNCTTISTQATLIPRIDERVLSGVGWGLYPTDVVKLGNGQTYGVVSARYGGGETSDDNGVLIVELFANGSKGDTFWVVNPQPTTVISFPTASDDLITLFNDYYGQTGVQPTWQWVQDSVIKYSKPSYDGFDLAEPSSVRFGEYDVELWRDLGQSGYNIVRVGDSSGFGTARVSKVSDTNGGSVRQMHWLQDGSLGLMGNADDSRFSLYFTRCKWAPNPTGWNMVTSYVQLIGIGTGSELFNSRVASKGGGTAYADFCQVTDNLMACLYSRQKEGIEVALWNLDGSTVSLPYEAQTIADLTPDAWYKASSISEVNGTPITSWLDSSGNGKNLTGNGTFYTTGQNGQPYVDLNGSTDYFYGAQAITSTNGRTLIIVAKADTLSDAGIVALTDAGTGSANIFNVTDGMKVDIGGSSIARSIYALTTLRIHTIAGWEGGYLVEPTGTNNWQEIKYRQNLTGSGLTTTVNPNVQYDTDSGLARIGRDNSSGYFDGKVYEVILWNRRLNRTEINQAGFILEKIYNLPIWGCDTVPQ